MYIMLLKLLYFNFKQNNSPVFLIYVEFTKCWPKVYQN